GAEFFDGGEAAARRGGAGFEGFGEVAIEGGDGDGGGDGMVFRELAEDVDVAGDEVVLGDEGDGIAKFGQDLAAAAGELELALDGLVAIGDAAHGDALRLPFPRGKLGAEELGGALLDEDASFRNRGRRTCRRTRGWGGR